MHSNKLTALAPLLMLAACQSLTTPTISTVDGVPTHAPNVTPPKYILCSLDPVIKYAGAKPGELDDATNHLDRAATIGDPQTRGTIRNHNTVVRAACGE